MNCLLSVQYSGGGGEEKFWSFLPIKLFALERNSATACQKHMKVMSDFLGKNVEFFAPVTFFFWSTKTFFVNFSKKCRIIFSMKMTVKNFQKFVFNEFCSKRFSKILQLISLTKIFFFFNKSKNFTMRGESNNFFKNIRYDLSFCFDFMLQACNRKNA